jgi:hypothetical protein
VFLVSGRSAIRVNPDIGIAPDGLNSRHSRLVRRPLVLHIARAEPLTTLVTRVFGAVSELSL